VTFLLDTHVLLWAIGQTDRLSARATKLILDPHTQLVASTVSLWEIAIKSQGGKLDVPATPEYFDFHFSRLGIRRVLSVDPSHTYALFKLPPIHKDPFDRLLVAQCVAERMQLVSADRIFRKYPIEVVW
jgi:PIN domain nuclease of toxin-antitoxin system